MTTHVKCPPGLQALRRYRLVAPAPEPATTYPTEVRRLAAGQGGWVLPDKIYRDRNDLLWLSGWACVVADPEHDQHGLSYFPDSRRVVQIERTELGARVLTWPPGHPIAACEPSDYAGDCPIIEFPGAVGLDQRWKSKSTGRVLILDSTLGTELGLHEEDNPGAKWTMTWHELRDGFELQPEDSP